VEGVFSQSVQAARLIDQVERQVETVRELSPRATVPLNFLDGHDLSALLQQLYLQRFPPTYFQPHVELGVLPQVPGAAKIRLSVGTYEPVAEQLYVTTDSPEISTEDQVLLLAHTYNYALQDQYFDLDAVDVHARTADAKLAVWALIEGDGMLLAGLYRHGDLESVDWPHVEDLILRARVPSYGKPLGNSDAWQRLQRFPYQEGRVFVSALFETGGWDAVDRAYANLPRSTEQVLHPERYVAAEPDVPTDVFLPDLSGVLGQSWALVVRETLGEFVTGIYLEQTLTQDMAWQAAEGWDGDTFVVWQGPDEERVRVWRTIWDNTSEASEFEQALVTLIPHRYPPTQPLTPLRGLPGRWWETDWGVVCVWRVARYVTFVSAPDVDTLAAVVEALP
jgi:hypothetical protein